MRTLSKTISEITPLSPYALKTKLDWALSMRAKGLAVFPLASDSKIPPAGSRGFKNATTDPQMIEKVWTDYPDANIGVYPGDHFVIVDLDIKHVGIDGVRSLSDLLGISDLDIEALTFSVRTPSGGLHLYFQTERPFGDKLGLLPGVDVRATGGYVVGPGSTIGGRPYEIVNTIEFVPLPSELAELLSAPRKRDAKADIPLCDIDLEVNIRSAIHFLKLRRSAIEGDNGDDWTYKTAAAVMRDFAISEAKCLDLMLAHWNERCEPPWSYSELENKIENADRYATGRAGEKVGYALDEWMEQFGDEGTDVSEIFDNRRKTDQSTRRFLPRSEAVQDHSPEPEWLIDQFIQAESINLLYGPQDSYKGFITLDMMLSGCALDSWAPGDSHSGFEIKRPLSVLYIAGEGARGIEKLRRQAWREAHGIAKGLPFFTIADMPRMTTETDIASLIEDIKSKESPCQKPDIIVIDTVVLAMAGADENSAKDSGILISACRELIRQFGCAVLLIHHTGKDEHKGARGSSNLIASCDSRFRVMVETGSSRDAPKVLVHCEKQKDSERAPSLRFQGRKVGDSLVFNRIAALKLGYETVDIVRRTLESIPPGDEPTSYRVAQQAKALNLIPGDTSEEAFRKKIDRELKKDSTRLSYGGMVKPQADGSYLFVRLKGMGEEDSDW